MTRGEIKAAAKEQLSGNVGKLFLAALIVGLLAGACAAIPLIGWLAALIVGPALSLGLTLLYLDISKGVYGTYGTLFDGFKQALPATLLNLMIAVFTFLWSLLLYIPGIVKAYSYMFARYILAEHPEKSASEALNASKEMTNGHKMEMFILQLSFLPWIFLSVITFGIATIYVVPYMELSMINLYHEVKVEWEIPKTTGNYEYTYSDGTS